MATLNNRRTLVTKRILKESFLDLLMKKPISKITIKEICDLSQMSRSTFYLHYEDQYALLKDIEDEAISKTFETLKEMNSELSALESIKYFLEYIKENKTTFGILLCKSENHLFQKAIMDNVEKYIKSIINKKIQENKEEYVFSFIMSGCLNMIITWINNDFDLSSSELAKLIYHSCNNVVRM